MIVYVDTSTLLKLLIDEPGSEEAGVIWDSADVVASALIVVVEARAALAAATRGRRLTPRQHRQAKTGLAALVDELAIVEVTGELVEQAAGVAERAALRGSHALHLAAALLVGADIFTSADTVLCDAAGGHGLHIANPLMA